MRIPRQFLRFCLVGLINTSVDVGVYALLRHTGMPLLAANMVSTSLGFMTSYMLNGRFTFRRRPGRRQFMMFAMVTCTGLWVLQPVLIQAVMSFGLTSTLMTKLVAVAGALAWNYVWYSRKVFTAPVGGDRGASWQASDTPPKC